MKKKHLTVLWSYGLMVFLLFSATTCSKNKDYLAKNIPECIKQKIKDDNLIVSAEEYCTPDGIKKIYCFIMGEVIFKGCVLQPPPQTWDDNCNLFLLDSDEYTPNPLNPDEWVWGYLLPDGTIEYKENIYHFKRIVFTKK